MLDLIRKTFAKGGCGEVRRQGKNTEADNCLMVF